MMYNHNRPVLSITVTYFQETITVQIGQIAPIFKKLFFETRSFAYQTGFNLPLGCWEFKHAPPCLIYMVPGLEPRALYMLAQNSTNFAMSPAP